MDDKILHSLLFFHYLRADQLCRLHFSPGSLPWVRSRRLKMLVEHKYLQLVVGRNNKPIKPYVYTLHYRGRTYLEELGTDVPGRFNSSEQAKKALLFLEHTLAINDILIAASLLARDFEDITLAHREHEATLKTKPLRVTYVQRLREGGETTTTQTLIPDAWLDMYVGDRKKQRYWRFSIWLELDRGTIQARKFIRKARSIIEYLKSGEYQKRFHSEVALIAFVTTAGQERVHQICTWIHEEAARTDDAGIEPLFFTTAISSPPDPLDFFFSPLWLRPDSDKPVPLFHTQE